MKWDVGSVLPASESTTPKERPTQRFKQVLLVLDGEHLSPESLGLALKGSVQVAHRLDILLINPPAAPTSMLRALLLRLEHAGIDYRLTSVEGDLWEQLTLYLKRFLRITTVLVESEALLEMRMGRTVVADMRQKGYRFFSYCD